VTIHGIRINVEVLNIVVCFLLFLLKSELDSLPKIDKFYVVFTIDHDVLGLQVSVRDSMLLEMGQNRSDLRCIGLGNLQT
jgi:hypothetical protein